MCNSTKAMVKYYDALSRADLQTVCECFDIPSKIISLYGAVNINSNADIIEVYSGIIRSWKIQNISNKIGYDKNSFNILKIQENIDMVKTRLINFELNGSFLQKWDCSYIVRKKNNDWLISLATTNNEASKSVK